MSFLQTTLMRMLPWHAVQYLGVCAVLISCDGMTTPPQPQHSQILICLRAIGGSSGPEGGDGGVRGPGVAGASPKSSGASARGSQKKSSVSGGHSGQVPSLEPLSKNSVAGRFGPMKIFLHRAQ